MRVVSVKEMREIENAAVKKYGIAEDVLMEHAGRSMAEEILNTFLLEGKDNKKIIIVCGHGGNGGDGLVCARYLLERGAEVYCYIIKPQKPYKELVLKNLKRAFFSHLSVKEIETPADLEDLKKSLKNSFLIVDALLGIGFEGEVRGLYKQTVDIINASCGRVVSADVPSGLNADTGVAGGSVVRAGETYALGFLKKGLFANHAKEYTGEIKVLPIGLPKDLL